MRNKNLNEKIEEATNRLNRIDEKMERLNDRLKIWNLRKEIYKKDKVRATSHLEALQKKII